MPSYPSVYRARSVKYEAPVLTAFVPQVFGDVPIEITDVIGSPTQGMGWVSFQGGNPEFPVWQGGVGGSVSDVMWVGPDAPTNNDIELWWDTDEPPQGGGTEEVYIGAEPPGAGYELWYDTDAEAPLTMEQRWNTAWGQIAYAQVITDQSGITATKVDLTGLAVTFTAVAGRRYKVTGSTNPYSNVANDVVITSLQSGATGLSYTAATVSVTNVSEGCTLTWISDGSHSGSTPMKLRMERYTGSGSVTNGAASFIPSFILVEDVGPVTLSPAPAPVDWSMYDERYAKEVDWSANVVWSGANAQPSLGSGGYFKAVYQRVGQWCDYALFGVFGTGVNGGTGLLSFNLPFAAAPTPYLEQIGTAKLYTPGAGGDFHGFSWTYSGQSALYPGFPVSRTDNLVGRWKSSTHPAALGTGTPALPGLWTVHDGGNITCHIRYKVA